MLGERVGRATRKIRVAAPAGVVYALLADATKWPLYFSRNVHVERLEYDGVRERLRMWCVMDGRLASWITWRHLDPVARRVEFRQELPGSQTHAPGGSLTVHELGPHDTELELRYVFSVTDDLPEDATWRERGADRYSSTMLTDVKHLAEQWTRLDELVLTCEDSIRIKGPAELAYDLLYRAGDWPELVPHVTGVDLVEDNPGIQHLTMRTFSEYGAHHSASVRLCFPHAGRIVWKQTETPVLVTGNTGEWSVLPDERGVTVTVRQNAVVREEHIAAVLGDGAGLAEARRYVRNALGGQGRKLLSLAKLHAESAVRML
ncbi:MAG TPA: SRPBCC family protein [Streptomyces sp.]|nr:SRPBCC family protein [Streptomyces sp.]